MRVTCEFYCVLENIRLKIFEGVLLIYSLHQVFAIVVYSGRCIDYTIGGSIGDLHGEIPDWICDQFCQFVAALAITAS